MIRALTFVVLVVSLSPSPEPSDLHPGRGDPEIMTASLPPATVAREYSHTLSAANGAPPYAWSPPKPLPWLSLSERGNLRGKPSECGTFSFVVELSDSASRRARRSVSIHVVGCKQSLPQ